MGKKILTANSANHALGRCTVAHYSNYTNPPKSNWRHFKAWFDIQKV